jgi:hypothetical protein
MTYKLRLTQEAKEIIVRDFLWYQEKSEGLGNRFITEIDAMMEYIRHHPHHFQVKYKYFREAVLKVFPYVIIYSIKANEIVIYMVFPTKIDPAKKPG